MGCASDREPGQSSGQNKNLVEAQASLAQARKEGSDPKSAAGHYLDAADESLRVALRNPPDATAARRLYNTASAELTVLLWSSTNLWRRTETFHSHNGEYRLHFAAGSKAEGRWDPGYFTSVMLPVPKKKNEPEEPGKLSGWGGVVVGFYKPADPRKYMLPRVGVAIPVTAALDFNGRSSGEGTSEVTLVLYDPTRRSNIPIAGAPRALAADFSAPLAYYPAEGSQGISGMLHPGKFEKRAGLYLAEPYDPDRIPIVFVHGLMSWPTMWGPTISGIETDPELRGRYQFWLFAYPTGDPISVSALTLREDLDKIYRLYPRTKPMVLVSHSLGGLLTQLQVVNSRRVLWDAVFEQDADRIYAKLPPDHTAKRALIFEANPRVRRVVFICTPHRGATLASGVAADLVEDLIHLPRKVVSTVGGKTLTALGMTKQEESFVFPSGVRGLAPQSTLLHGLDTLPIVPSYHSIIGDRGRHDTPNSSDGVVAYWSSHMNGAKSEVIVPGPHGSCTLPQTIRELKRILHLELQTRQ